MNQITDYFDQPLAVGDRIVYPVGMGSSGVSLSDATIDLIEELVPDDPTNPACRRGTKYSERHLPPNRRKSLELPMRYDPSVPNSRGGRGLYVYDETKLFKLRVRFFNREGKPGNKTSWIKNVDRVIRAPQEAQPNA